MNTKQEKRKMTEITVYNGQQTDLATNSRLWEAGQVANHVASQHIFTEYKQRKSINTLSAQRTDLQTFCDYLASAGIYVECDALQDDPTQWESITHGLVVGFVKWMGKEGFSTSTINRKLSTIKVYAKLAYQAGAISVDENSKIRIVSGYSGKDATNFDKTRESTRIDTVSYVRKDGKKVERVTEKKEESNFLSPVKYRELLALQTDNNAGLRNKVLLGLLFEYGLRVSEVTTLTLDAIDIDNGLMTVYRSKTDETTKFDLLVTPEFYRTLKAYFALCNSTQVYLILPVTKSDVTEPSYDDNGNVLPVTRTAIFRYIKRLGEKVGIDNLSPHDARHTALQLLLEKNVPDSTIMDFFGWKTRNMIDQYRQRAKIANTGVSVM